MSLKRIAFFAGLLLLTSCSGKILSIQSSIKQVHYPGVPSGSTFIQYQINFTSASDFLITNVSVVDGQKISDYSLFKTATGTYVNVAEQQPMGDYVLSFKSPAIQLIDRDESVSLSIKNHKKIENYQIQLVKKEAFHAR